MSRLRNFCNRSGEFCVQGAAATRGQGFVDFVFAPFVTAGFGPASRACKFPPLELLLKRVQELMPHLVCKLIVSTYAWQICAKITKRASIFFKLSDKGSS